MRAICCRAAPATRISTAWIGNDTLAGDDGADNDRLSGGAGNDALWGDDAVPLAWGKEDDDMLVAGEGTDRLDGGGPPVTSRACP